MGIEKAGLQLGKELIAWTRNGKSLLATRPVKINTSELKYVPEPIEDTFELTSKKLEQVVGKSESKLKNVTKPLTKEEEIKILENNFKKRRMQFIKYHENNLPSYEERYNEVLISTRTSYGGSYREQMNEAKFIAKCKDEYLDFIWEKSPEARELLLELKLKRMSSKELDMYNKAISALDKRNMPYDKLEIAEMKDSYIRAIADNKFSYDNWVVAHDDAYMFNSLLRQGKDIKHPIITMLDEGFKTVKPTTTSKTLYRQVCGSKIDGSINFIDFLKQAKKGDTFIDNGYSFATFNRDCATSCNGIQDIGSPLIMLKILTPQGTKISCPMFSSQCEALFPRGSKFRIAKEAKVITPASTFTDKNGNILHSGGELEIVVEYVLPKT